jgi:DNA-binding NarL/FixJ family response regulator
MSKTVPIKVSIVEDDSQTREILSGWVSRADGFQCVSNHSSGEDALAQIPEQKPEIVLMDINLPGIKGPECVRRLKPLLPGTQFVMLTVYEDSDHIFQALQAGATGYLLKQTRRAELISALSNVHAGGSPMSANIARKVVQCFHQPLPLTQAEDALPSPREREVLELLARGYLYKEIAESLKISQVTVNTYVRRIYEKLHVHSRSQAIAKYTGIAKTPGRPAHQ